MLKSLAALLILLPVAFASATEPVHFVAAQPAWPEDQREVKNLFVGFQAVVEGVETRDITLRLTASSVYRAFVNGTFVGYGPARGPHGHYRVDEWPITEHMSIGPNIIAIEVAGYNIDSYYLLNQPPFLQAEVVAGDRVLAATGAGYAPFQATVLDERIRKVQRYSKQRPFTEAYRLRPEYDRWRNEPAYVRDLAFCELLDDVPLLPRGVPYPDFTERPAHWHVATGQVDPDGEIADEDQARSFVRIGVNRGGFAPEELEATPVLDLERMTNVWSQPVNSPVSWDAPLPLGPEAFQILDLGTNLTGFLQLRVTCELATRLFVTFDEILIDGDVHYRRNHNANAVLYELEPGTYDLETFEPYTLRYLKIIGLDGACTIDHVGLREYATPDVWTAALATSDDDLNKLFDAARETYRQNTLDVFMDCPGRERAGWLCDSFFTARVAPLLSGHTRVEQNFLENYLLPSAFDRIPKGMLPMCYPADHRENSFIPNWALWFVVELGEYLDRSGDRELIDALEPRVMALFDYFEPFLNQDGLLEKLQGWVFLEWSKANDFTQDVNYPSNMLYAGALDVAGRLYGKPAFLLRAQRIRETIRRQAFDGTFFVDHALRKDARLEVQPDRTETCQYYAFFFDVASPASHPALWMTLVEQFGPQRKETGAFPDVHPSNAFIGNVLRLEILSRYGRCQQVLNEMKGYYLYMARQTGTLWENITPRASCNHGFASHVANLLYRDVLGLYKVDTVDRKIMLRFADCGLSFGRGRIPTPQGLIQLEWRLNDGQLTYRIDAPAGYDIRASTVDQTSITREP